MLSRLVAKIVVIAPPSASSVSNFDIFIFWFAVKTYHLVELRWPYILSFNIGKGVMWGFSFVFDDKNARQGKGSNDSRTKVEKVIFKTWGKAVIKTWHFSLIYVDILTLETCEGISQLLELESFRWAAWFSGKVRDWKYKSSGFNSSF